MAYTDPSTLTFALNENPLQSSKMNQSTNDQFLALFPDDETGVAWSPTLEATGTDPTTSSVSGIQYRVGAIRFVWARWVLTAGGSGTYFVTLPDTAVGLTGSTSAGQGQSLGSFQIVDTANPHMLGGTVLLRSTTTAFFNADSVAHGTNSGVITDSTPRAWTTAVLSFEARYPIA